MDAKNFDPSPDAGAAAPEWPTPDSIYDGPLKVDKPPRKNPRRHVAPVKLSLPLELSPASCSPGYAPSRIDDIALNSTPQRVALKLLTASLTAHKAELNDGTRITRPQHAVQWLLDQIAIALPSDVLDELMDVAV